MSYPKLIENLIDELVKLPGIGRRGAERIVFWMLSHSKEEVEGISSGISKLKEGLRFCKTCHNFSEDLLCLICQNQDRDTSIVCVVENPKDLLAIERSGSYKGLYHVLLGTISPQEGRGPDDIQIGTLLYRLQQGQVKEVIIATDPDNDGEMTALYLAKQLKNYPVKISRIGLGIPMGSAVEFVDISTLSVSLTARRDITE